MLQRIWLVCGAMILTVASVTALQPAGGQSEFVPASTLPPGDQLPAAPLLVAAYAFVWLAAMFYVWTVWRRLNKVEAEMRALDERRAQRNRTR
jgi:CcmD family protein